MNQNGVTACWGCGGHVRAHGPFTVEDGVCVECAAVKAKGSGSMRLVLAALVCIAAIVSFVLEALGARSK